MAGREMEMEALRNQKLVKWCQDGGDKPEGKRTTGWAAGRKGAGRGPPEEEGLMSLLSARASPGIQSIAPPEHCPVPFRFPQLVLLSLTVAPSHSTQMQQELCLLQKHVISHNPRLAEVGMHLCRLSADPLVQPVSGRMGSSAP